MTALSEAVKAELGITEPLPKPALLSPSPGWSTLADDLKRTRVSRLLPKVTCPSPFHPRARTVPIAELQDVPVTETEKRGLSALAPLAGVSPSPSPMILAAVFSQNSKSRQKGVFSREMTYFFGFYGPKIGGGVLLPKICPKISKTLKFGLFWGIFASSGLVLQNSAAHQCACL